MLKGIKILLAAGYLATLISCNHSHNMQTQTQTSGQDGRGGFDYHDDVIPEIKKNIALLSTSILELPSGELEYLSYKYSQGKKPIDRDKLSKIIANTKLSPAQNRTKLNLDDNILYPLKMDVDDTAGVIEALQPLFENYKNSKDKDKLNQALLHEALHLFKYSDDKMAEALAIDISWSLEDAHKGCGLNGTLQQRLDHCKFRYPNQEIPLLEYHIRSGNIYFKLDNMFVYFIGKITSDREHSQADLAADCRSFLDTVHGELNWHTPTLKEAAKILQRKLGLDSADWFIQSNNSWINQEGVYAVKNSDSSIVTKSVSFNWLYVAIEPEEVGIFCVAMMDH